MAVLLVAILIGAIVMSFRQVSLENSEIRELADSRSQIRLQIEVINDPKVIKGDRISFIAKAKGVPIRVIGPATELLPSQKLFARGKLILSKEPRVAALFLTWQRFEVIADPNPLQILFGDIRSGLRSAAKDAPLIPGMVLGDTSMQSPQFTNAMRRAGLTHLTAVSGANFAIVSAFVLWLMQFLIKNPRLRLLVTFLVLLLFIGLVRPSPSVLRAAAMAAVVIFAKMHRERSDSLPALGFAIAIVVIADPWQARDPGFALSVLATTGLLLIAPKIRAPKIISEPIAASVLCAPVIVYLSGYLSMTAILANILAAPLVAPITILGFIAALLPPIAPLLISIAKIPANLITKIAYLAAEPAVIQLRSGLLLLLIGLLFWIFCRWWWLLLAIILISTFLQRWPNNDWQIVNCDVGQGDALVLKVDSKVNSRSAVVIDVGPEPELIDACLKDLGIIEIPLLILTHAHKDHVGGVLGATRKRKVGQILTSAMRGQIFNVGELKIEILWPESNFQDQSNGSMSALNENFAVSGESSEINNLSIVALITAPDYTLLTTGDLEPDAQQQIPVGKVKFLKVAHHGSKLQDPKFNLSADPDFAIISVGRGNSYGHPAATTLSLFRKVLRTDQLGSIAIDPKKLSISSSKVGVLGLPVLWRIA